MKNISDDVLVKYLLGEATPDERSTVGEWMAADENNKKYFDHFQLIWDESKHLASQSTVNENEAWQRFVQRTRQEEIPVQQQTRSIPLHKLGWARAAAVLVLITGAAWLIYTMTGGGTEQMIANSGNSVLIQTLPDGSTVTLNRNSSISYPSKFVDDTRAVTLKGEAFFSITPDKQHPFIIDVNNASVKVVGTTFNVKSTADGTEVIVETGIVEVAKMEHAIRVLPHQKATVSRNSDAPVMEENTDELYNYYRTKEFVCKGTPLWKLAAVLNEAYDANIVIENEKIKNLPLDVTFHDEPLDDMLKVICATLNISQERSGKKIILK